MNYSRTIISALTIALGAAALAQPAAGPGPDQPPPERPARRGDNSGPGFGPGMREMVARDPRLLKEFIDRQTDQLSRAIKKLEEAKQELASGAKPEDVFRQLREARATFMADNFFANWRDRQPPGQQSGNPDSGPPQSPSPEQIDEMITFVREFRPEFADRLSRWRKEEPRIFMMIASRLLHQARDTFREKDRDPALFELRKEDLRNNVLIVEKSAELTRMLRESSGPGNDPALKQARIELRELLGKGYDSRVKVREYEAAKLESKLKETRSKIQETKDVREQMLDRTLDEISTRRRPSAQPGDDRGGEPPFQNGPQGTPPAGPRNGPH